MTSLLRSLAATPALDAARPVNKLPVPIVNPNIDYRTTGGGWINGEDMSGADKEAQAGAMSANGTLFAIIDALSSDVSRVKWRLWRKAASGEPDDRTPGPPTHPSVKLFAKPNPHMSWKRFCATVQQHRDLTGEGDMLTSWALGMPFELWPVYPHRLAPVPDPYAFLKGWIYASPDGQRVPLDLREVTQILGPNPLNMFRGLSGVQAIAPELAATRAASDWNANFFRNSARPGGVIEQDKEASGLSDGELREFAQRWREAHQGVGNAHRIAILEAGMKWVATSYNLRDMQFVELRGVARDTVREAYRFPISKLGTVEDVNRANGEAQETHYARNLLTPRLDEWKAWRNESIMPSFPGSEDLEWDYSNPVPEDTETANAALTAKSAAAQIFVNIGYEAPAVLEALELPDMGTWSKPEPPAPPALPGAGGARKAPAENALNWVPAWPGASPAGRGEWAPWIEGEIVDAIEPTITAALGDAWATALDEALVQWQAEVSPAQRDAAVEQAQQAIDGGDVAALAALVVPVLGAALLTAAIV